MADQRRGGDGDGDGAAGRAGELRDALAGLLDPRQVVMLTRERIEEALQDAVSRGRVTADDAADLVAALVERGRRPTGELFEELERVVGAKAGLVRGVRGRADGGDELPIADYGDLTAAEVQARLDGLTPAQLRRVSEHERANANRKTVLAAIERRLK